jgi:hypothetical protein
MSEVKTPDSSLSPNSPEETYLLEITTHPVADQHDTREIPLILAQVSGLRALTDAIRLLKVWDYRWRC